MVSFELVMPTDLFDQTALGLHIATKCELAMNSLSEYNELRANDKTKTVIDSKLKREDSTIQVGVNSLQIYTEDFNAERLYLLKPYHVMVNMQTLKRY